MTLFIHCLQKSDTIYRETLKCVNKIISKMKGMLESKLNLIKYFGYGRRMKKYFALT